MSLPPITAIEKRLLAKIRQLEVELEERDSIISRVMHDLRMAQWQPIETLADHTREVLLYFPAKVVGAHAQHTLPAMRKMGRRDDFPNRAPSHWLDPGVPEQ